MKGGDNIKIFFFSTLVFLAGFMMLSIDSEEENTNLQKSFVVMNNDSIFIKKEKQKNDVVNDVSKIIDEETIQQVEEEKIIPKTNINSKLEEIDLIIANTKEILNNSSDIDEISEEYNILMELIDNNINILSKEQILEAEQIKESYANLIKVHEFMTKANNLLQEGKTSDSINTLREENQKVNFLDLIENINNAYFKENYKLKYEDVNKILSDITKPIVNVENNKIYNDAINLEINDETNYITYLNDELLTEKLISQEGKYHLKVIDEALNETIVDFEIKKEKVVYSLNNTFQKPMQNFYLTQAFKGKDNHMGIDLGSSNKQEKIYPVASGTVIYVGKDKYGANIVKIKHNEKLYSTYAHMSVVYFYKGQQVTKNDLLGLMGSTGNSTGPHLHLEMTTCDWTYNCSYLTYKNSLVNPLDYI